MCAAGISGSDLKRRIEDIMRNAWLAELSLAKKTLLGLATLLALVTPLAIGILGASAIRAQLRTPASPSAPAAAATSAPQPTAIAQSQASTPPPVAQPPAVPGTWTDPGTGLLWAASDNGSDVTQRQAGEYCSALELGNLKGWRLPTIVEARSIYVAPDFDGQWGPAMGGTGGQVGAGVNGVWRIKGGIGISGDTWTSTQARDPGQYTYFHFDHGVQYAAGETFSHGRALCVSGQNQPVARAVADTWTDPKTKLTWATQDSGTNVSQTKAAEYCGTLHLAGFTDWRLPEIAELAAIYDPSSVMHPPDGEGDAHVRGGIQLTTGNVWSATVGENPGQAWMLTYYSGYRMSVPADQAPPVRAVCVRGGASTSVRLLVQAPSQAAARVAPTVASGAPCPVTTPAKSFSPPSQYVLEGPFDRMFWYGNNDLWMALPGDGVWHAGAEKLLLWKLGYDGMTEPRPDITIVQKQLDGTGPEVQTRGGTSAFDKGTWKMMWGITFPHSGCWEVTVANNGHSLTFVGIVR